MRSLLVILAYHVVGKKRLTTTRRTQDELVTVGNHAALHWQVGDVEVDGLTRKSVSHLDTKGRERILIVRLCRKETEGRLDESIE